MLTYGQQVRRLTLYIRYILTVVFKNNSYYCWQAPDDLGDCYNHTLISSYGLYGDLNDDNVQILKEAPSGLNKFGHPYRTSYVLKSPYLISRFKWVRNIKSLPAIELTDVKLNERASVDINPLRGIEDLTLFDEFD